MQGSPTEIDWARLAVLIDGEGYIGIATAYSRKRNWARPHLYLDVRVVNTDPRVAEWCAANFGGKVYLNKRKAGHEKWSTAIHWAVSCNKAEAVLRGCLPYFLIKREQAEVALAFQATIDRAKSNGVKGVPTEVVLHQVELRNALQELKGTSSRGRGMNKALNEYLRGVGCSDETPKQVN